MKLLVVTPYYAPHIGGLETYARQLAIAMRDHHGVEVVVATSGGPRGARDVVDGIPVYRLPTRFTFSNTPVGTAWPRQLRRIISLERPDVVHAHTPVPSMAMAAWVAGRGLPLALSYHAATLKKDTGRAFNAIAAVYETLERITLLRRAQLVLPVSEFVRDRLPARARARSTVLPNSVWSGTVLPRAEQPRTAGLVFISSLARSHAWKGLDDVLRAINEVQRPDVHLTVVGDGDHRGHYEAAAARLGIGSLVTFTGALQGAAKDRVLSDAAALIAYPTSSNDAFPTVFLEAWAAGVPVVASSIGAIPSLVQDRDNGYLAPPGDPAALARTLDHVLDSPDEAGAVAGRAAARVGRQYTWEIQSKVLDDALRRLA